MLHIRDIVPSHPRSGGPAESFNDAHFPSTRLSHSHAEENCDSRLTPKAATWFYRYNARCLEVRDLRNCVLAIVHIDQLAPPEEEAYISLAAGHPIGNTDSIFICVWYRSSRCTRLWRFSPLSQLLHSVGLELHRQKAVAVEVTQMCKTVGAKIQHCQYLIVCTEFSIHMASVDGLERGDMQLQFDEAILEGPSDLGKICSMTTCIPPNSSTPIVFTGTERGFVHMWQAHPDSGHGLGVFSTLRALRKNVPITQLTYDGAENTSKQYGTLFLGQSEKQGEIDDARSLPSPTIMAVRLDQKFQQVDVIAKYEPLEGQAGLLLQMRVARLKDHYRIFWLTMNCLGDHITTELFIAETSHSNGPRRQQIPTGIASKRMDLDISINGLGCNILYVDKVVSYMHPIGKREMQLPNPMDNLSLQRPSFFPYKPERRDSILRMRDRMENELFIDWFLKSNGIAAWTSYPPRDPQELQLLSNAIMASDVDQLKKDCVMLYLLKDWKNGKDIEFARERLIDEGLQREIEGYWELDHGHLEDGIRCLGHPSVTTHCADKLIRLMVSRGKYAEASRFVQAVSPEPSTDKDIRFRMALHLKISLLDALRFQRRYRTSPLGDILWQQFVQYSFHNQNLATSVFTQLLALPFDAEEETLLARYCRSSRNTMCQSFLIVYYVQRNRFAEGARCIQGLGDLGLDGGFGGLARWVTFTKSDILAFANNLLLLLPNMQRLAVESNIAGTSNNVSDRMLPLSAHAAIRGSPKSQSEAQQTLLRALQSALPEELSLKMPRRDDINVDISLDGSMVEIGDLAMSPILSDEQDREFRSSPEPISSADVSRPTSPTPTGRSTIEDRRLLTPPTKRHVNFAEPLDFAVSSSPPSDRESEPSRVPTPPPIPTPMQIEYESTTADDENISEPIPLPNSVSDMPPNLYRTPEPLGRRCGATSEIQNRPQEERVVCVKSPVGEPVTQAPPMMSMSPFSPREEDSQNFKEIISAGPKSDVAMGLPPRPKTRVNHLARSAAPAAPSPTRRSGRLAAKAEKQVEEQQHLEPELGQKSTTRKRAKVTEANARTKTPARARTQKLMEEEDDENEELQTSAPAARKRAMSTKKKLIINEEPDPVNIPAVPKGRKSVARKLAFDQKPPKPEPVSTTALREQNKTPAAKRSTITKSTKKTTFDVPMTPAQDEPMTLDELDTPATGRSRAASRRKTLIQEADENDKPTRKSRASATPAPQRTVVTRRMAKQMEGAI